MDLSSINPSPNSKDHPELIDWMKRYSDAQRAYVGFNDKDLSNYLDEADHQETKARLYEAIKDANKQIVFWCNHYNINYNDLKIH